MGEIVSGVAVVVTLAYLIVQIRQNTRGIHAATIQTNVSDFNSLNIHLAENTRLAEVFDRGSSAPETLSREDEYSFLWLTRSYMNLYQNLFDQYRQGTLPERIWTKHTQELKVLAALPGFRKFRTSDTYYEELWAHVDDLPAVGHVTSLKLRPENDAGRTE